MRESGITRRGVAIACLATALAASGTARGAEDYVPGIAIGFLTPILAGAAATPYFILHDKRAPGFSAVGLDLGVAGHANIFGMSFDIGGYGRRDAWFGWMGRARTDLAGKPLIADGVWAIRIDSLALAALAGDPQGPLSLEGLGGLSVWPRVVSKVGGSLQAFAAIGPTAGLRLRALADKPRVFAELELTYTPFFGAPQSGRLHQIDVQSAIAWFPWPTTLGAPAFEARVRHEIGLGGAERNPSVGIIVLGGLRFRVDSP